MDNHWKPKWCVFFFFCVFFFYYRKYVSHLGNDKIYFKIDVPSPQKCGFIWFWKKKQYICFFLKCTFKLISFFFFFFFFYKCQELCNHKNLCFCGLAPRDILQPDLFLCYTNLKRLNIYLDSHEGVCRGPLFFLCFCMLVAPHNCFGHTTNFIWWN